MNEVPATFGMAARIFWAIIWRTFLISIPIIFIVGVSTAAIFSSLGNEGANAVARLATFVVAIPIQIACLQRVIGKSFGKCKLTLLSTEPRDSA